MSLRVMTLVWERSAHKGSDLLVLQAIADNANDDGFARPPRGYLALKSRLAVGGVRHVLRRLLAGDELELVAEGGGARANEYRVRLEVLQERPSVFDAEGVQVGPGPSWTPVQGRTPNRTGSGSASEIPPRGVSPQPHPRPPRAERAETEGEVREDVERLCSLLAELVEAHGTPRSRIKWPSQTWRTAARLLLDRDGRPLEEAERLIRWCQEDEFWRSNVLSMPTFRKQYDKLRLRAAAGRNGTTADGPAKSPDEIAREAAAALEAARA